ncbi:putative zinc-binding oxidoreductase [Hyaloraphidium curvatum]|nr:putative zinc-binding oxidoreductase [Hyaloraphidium curvatum]
MRAAVVTGAPPSGISVSSAPDPPSPPPAGRLLVRVAAAGINPVDYKLASMPLVGWFRKGSIAGLDFSGVVERVPEGYAGEWKVGDAVFGFASGTLAEYLVANETEVARKPEKLGHVEAAALPTAAVTSLQALRTAGVKEGSQVLVIGASGGCGSTGVQLAKVMGATVTGICSAASAAFVGSLGADTVVDYADKAALDALAAAPKFDAVYDTVTSPEDADYSFLSPALKKGGRWVAINGFARDWARRFLPFVGERAGYSLILTQHVGKDVEEVGKYAAEGRLKAAVEGTYRLAAEGEVAEAFARLKSRRTKGKLVVVCDEALAGGAAGAGKS